MTPGTRKAFEELLNKLRPEVARAFREAVDDVRSSAQLRIIEDAIRRQDVQAVVQALQLGPEFFAPLDQAIQDAFIKGGAFQIARTPPLPNPAGDGDLVIRFNGRTPRAEAFALTTGELIREITEETRDMVRDVVSEGIAEGRNPRETALQIVGRTNRATGRREGGLLGLTTQQAAWVRNMDAELRDPARMGGYFDRARRDRRFDPIVRAAMREGKPVSAADRARITGRYSDRLLKLRGEMIARTETIRALNAGRMEGIQQMIDRGAINADQVKVRWSATLDDRTRDSHVALNGQEASFGEPFRSPATGALMRYPGDTELGAHGEDIIGCRCMVDYSIDFLKGLRAA